MKVQILVRPNVKLGIEIVFLPCYTMESKRSKQRWEISLRPFFADEIFADENVGAI